MKKAFTIVEVSILFVIFLIVAFLVAPLSLDDSRQAGYTSKWRNVQPDFVNIFYSVKASEVKDFKETLTKTIQNEIKSDAKTYRVTYLNGASPIEKYRFSDFKTTYSNSTLALKFAEDGKSAILMYDVNGSTGPNVWGKDIFGLNIYEDRFEPFGKNEPNSLQKKDCSKSGTGLFCSNYYLIGGSFD